MDLCAGLVFCVMMIAIWLDDAGFWKWLGKKTSMNGERHA
jgi:hypothetical protein